MNNKILLSFLAIKQDTFDFKIYRRIVNPNQKKTTDSLVVGLQISDQDKTKNNYEISFFEKDDFEVYQVKSYYNITLTKNYIFHALEQSAKELKIDIQLSDKNKFIKEIYFELEKKSDASRGIVLSAYYLAAQNIFGFIVDFRIKCEHNSEYSRELQKFSFSLDKNGKSNKNFYNDKFNYVKSFLDNSFRIIENTIYDKYGFNVHNNLYPVDSFSLEKKEYVFNLGKNKSYSQFIGLNDYGPYKKNEGNFHYIFIFQDKHKSFANDIFLNLLGKTNPGIFGGMEKVFKMSFRNTNVERLRVIGEFNIENILSMLEGKKAELADKKIIVIYIEDIPINNYSAVGSFYYRLKYELMKMNVPLQVINSAKIDDPNALKWSSSNIGLQLFSKSGGIPWIVNSKNKNCLILGVGSSHKYENEEIKKYFAYTVCLDSSGLYKKLEILSENSKYESYLDSLKINLIKLLKNEEYRNYNKCVLHLPFKIKSDEIEKIKSAINEISSMEFQVIKINTVNKYFGYSEHLTKIPYESTAINLSEDEYLIWFEGLNYGKENVYQRTANPIHIKFLNTVTNKLSEQKNYLQDVINLSGANWRGFNAKSIPISIYYSKIISDYAKVFESYEGYKPSILINNKPWFL